MKALEPFMTDLQTFLRTSVTTTTKIEQFFGYEFPSEEYEFHDQEALTSFLSRWQLHREASGENLVIASREEVLLYAYVVKSPDPLVSCSITQNVDDGLVPEAALSDPSLS